MVIARFLPTALLVTAASAGDVNVPTCGVGDGWPGNVMKVTDGKYDRCISVVPPYPLPSEPMPVLFWFHGAGGNAKNCGEQLGALAQKYGFTLICGEALQNIYGEGGEWTIPEVQTDATGTRCDDADSLDVVYMKNAVAALKTSPFPLDTTRLFTSGCSFGSGFSSYIGNCWKKLHPEHVSAFATHSTGLKVKGDGNQWPKEVFDHKYITAECPDCQYFPIVPEAHRDELGLKACIFDNAEDPTAEDPYFYRSSVALAGNWTALGNRAETHFASGGHCMIHSFEDIVTCLDDGTGRLLSKSQLV